MSSKPPCTTRARSPKRASAAPGPPPPHRRPGRCRGPGGRVGPRAAGGRARRRRPWRRRPSWRDRRESSSTTSRAITGRCSNAAAHRAWFPSRRSPVASSRRACRQPPGRTMPFGFSLPNRLGGSGRSRGFTAPTGGLESGPGWVCRSSVGCARSCPRFVVCRRSSDPEAGSTGPRADATCWPAALCSRHRCGVPDLDAGEHAGDHRPRWSRPAYSRRDGGIATRPCLSGVTSRASAKNDRAASSVVLSPLRTSPGSRSATPSNSSGVYTARQPPRTAPMHGPLGQGRNSAGRITRPLASRECWNSPRNPSALDPLTSESRSGPRHPAPSRSPIHHLAPLYAPLSPPSTHSRATPRASEPRLAHHASAPHRVRRRPACCDHDAPRTPRLTVARGVDAATAAPTGDAMLAAWARGCSRTARARSTHWSQTAGGSSWPMPAIST